MQTGAQRLVAVKARISDISASQPSLEPGRPTGLLLPNGVTAYRFNLIGTVVLGPDISDTSATIAIDDGTGSLVIRSFDQPELLEDLKPGQVVTIIGRPRQHADGVAIAPEIVKPAAPLWLLVRTKEIECAKALVLPYPESRSRLVPSSSKEESAVSRSGQWQTGRHVIEEDIVIEESQTPERIISNLIKKHDAGNGAEAAAVLAAAGIPNGEAILEKLLKNGDIFAVGAGRYKVLE